MALRLLVGQIGPAGAQQRPTRAAYGACQRKLSSRPPQSIVSSSLKVVSDARLATLQRTITRARGDRGAVRLTPIACAGNLAAETPATVSTGPIEYPWHQELPAVTRWLLAPAISLCNFFAVRGGLRSLLFGMPASNLSHAMAATFMIGWPTVDFSALGSLMQNYVFQVGFVAWFIAQFMKIFTYRARKGKWRLKAMVDSGGMPSSHSSLCSGVTTAVGMMHGVSSSLFAACLCFSVIVMYDAAGVRRHAGKQAEVLNMIIKDLWEGHPVSERQLKAVLRSPGASDSSISLPEDIEADKRLTLTTYSSRSFDDNEESLKKTVSAALGAEPEGGVAKHKLARLEQVKVISAAGEGDLPGNEAKLKEVLGHTPVQVACGAALGLFVGICMKPL